MARPRTLIDIAIPAVRDDIVRAARKHVEIISSQDWDNAADHSVRDIDLIIADVVALRAIARDFRRSGMADVQRVPAIILVLSDVELQDALGFLHFCRGIMFWEHDLDRLGRLLVITLEGYSGVPSEMLPDLVTDRVRVGLIDKLSSLEQRTLRLLGAALTNRAIARELEVPDPVAKSLVRAVLTKLRLKNRTEAAVLAARWYGAQGDAPTRGAASTAEQVAS